MKNYNLAAASLLIIFLIPLISHAQDCSPSGSITGKSPPPGTTCNQDHGSECCEDGARYPTYDCSPPVITGGDTQATLTLNGFEEGGDGGGASSCDRKYHDGKTERIVALSTGWFDGESRCGKNIRITAADGNQVDAMVVDECDSNKGCDEEHSYQPPCENNSGCF